MEKPATQSNTFCHPTSTLPSYSTPLHSPDASPFSPLPTFAHSLIMVPQLPPELIEAIIQLSLPHVAYSTFTERYDTLLRFHLVNKTWSAFARIELFRHLNVETEK